MSVEFDCLSRQSKRMIWSVECFPVVYEYYPLDSESTVRDEFKWSIMRPLIENFGRLHVWLNSRAELKSFEVDHIAIVDDTICTTEIPLSLSLFSFWRYVFIDIIDASCYSNFSLAVKIFLFMENFPPTSFPTSPTELDSPSLVSRTRFRSLSLHQISLALSLSLFLTLTLWLPLSVYLRLLTLSLSIEFKAQSNCHTIIDFSLSFYYFNLL